MVRMTENLRRRRMQGEGGFTLIELLIVIVILGILAGVVVASVSGITNTGGLAACKADTKTIITAEETYFATPGPPLGVGGGGVGAPSAYASMNWPYTTAPTPGPLVPAFLQAVSTLHAVQFQPAGGGLPVRYTIYVTDKQCAGNTPGNALPAPTGTAPSVGQLGLAAVVPGNPQNS